jgi:hypothetical protein
MRYLRMLGLVGLVMGAMLALGGGAQATVITQAPPFTGTAKAESEGEVEIWGSLIVDCQKSALEWNVEFHGASVTVSGPLTAFTLEECGDNTVTVVNKGSLELHATSGGNGTLTSTGAEITFLTHRPFLGTVHCIYKTNETDIGTLTGSSATGGTATLDIDGISLPRITTSFGCGTHSTLDGSYKFTTPDYLYVE